MTRIIMTPNILFTLVTLSCFFYSTNVIAQFDTASTKLPPLDAFYPSEIQLERMPSAAEFPNKKELEEKIKLEPISRFLFTKHPRNIIDNCEFSDDNNYLLVAAAEYPATAMAVPQVLDLKQGKRITCFPTSYNRPVEANKASALSRDGKLIAFFYTFDNHD
ncbi:MAG: hypothetical protein ACRC2T_13930 [Thermoguttaceae bacterium]